jgi:hypothetical protein
LEGHHAQSSKQLFEYWNPPVQNIIRELSKNSQECKDQQSCDVAEFTHLKVKISEAFDKALDFLTLKKQEMLKELAEKQEKNQAALAHYHKSLSEQECAWKMENRAVQKAMQPFTPAWGVVASAAYSKLAE